MTNLGRSGRFGVRVVPLGPHDLKAAARLHTKAFPGFFLSTLGPGVLREFYRGHLDSATAVAAVAKDADGQLIGIVAGTTSPASIYRTMLSRHPVRLAIAVGLALVRRPSALPRILTGLSHGAPVPWDVSDAALLSSICVDPDARRGGVGKALMEGWLSAVAATGHSSRAYLTTDAVGNDAVMRWYTDNGWELLGTFSRPDDGRVLAGFQRTFPAIPSA